MCVKIYKKWSAMVLCGNLDFAEENVSSIDCAGRIVLFYSNATKLKNRRML